MGRLEFDRTGRDGKASDGDEVAPMAVENFRALATGERGVSEGGRRLHFKGCSGSLPLGLDLISVSLIFCFVF